MSGSIPRRSLRMLPVLALAVIPLIALVIACGGADSEPASPTSPPQPTAVPASPTSALATGFNPAKLPPALMGMERVNSLIGASIQTLRDKITDPQIPFSSVPTMGNTLAAQDVSLIANVFQTTAAPPAGRPYNVQNSVQGYPAVNNATTAFGALRTAWQGNLFQNLQQQANLGAVWQESFCQLGDFPSATGGQTTQWYVCMARSGPYIVTVSIGAFPGVDVNSIASVVRAYFDEAQRLLQ